MAGSLHWGCLGLRVQGLGLGPRNVEHVEKSDYTKVSVIRVAPICLQLPVV